VKTGIHDGIYGAYKNSFPAKAQRRKLMLRFLEGPPVNIHSGGKVTSFCPRFLVSTTGSGRVIDASSDKRKIGSLQAAGRVITDHLPTPRRSPGLQLPLSESKILRPPLRRFLLVNHLDSLIDSYGGHVFSRDWTAGENSCAAGMPLIQERKVDLLLERPGGLGDGDVRWKSFNTPGAYPGHLAFYFPEERFFFHGKIWILPKPGPYMRTAPRA